MDALRGLRALVVAALLGSAAPAAGQGTDAWPSTTDWLIAGGALTTAFLLDDEVREELYSERPGDGGALERIGNRFGNPLLASSAIALGFAAGHLTGEPGLARGSARAAAGFVATGAVTQTLKWAVGRPRPDLGPDDEQLRPLSTDNDHQAWPSGHAAVAFSLATSVTMESDRAWVGAVAYGLAGVTAWSRVRADRHWASDVVAGAAIGTLATRTTIRWLEARASGRETPVLSIGPGGAALTFPVP